MQTHQLHQLLPDSYRSTADTAVLHLLAQPQLLPALIDATETAREPMALRLSRVVALLAQHQAGLLRPHLPRIVHYCQHTPHTSVRRSYLSIALQYQQELNEELLLALTDSCLLWLQQPTSATAVVALCLKYLLATAQLVPEIAPEIALVLENQLHNLRPNEQRFARRYLQQLQRHTLQSNRKEY